MKRLCLTVVLVVMVCLVVGCGPTAPLVVGRPLSAATAELESAGFQVGNITYDDGASEATGTVIAQLPKASDRASGESSVALTVAGPPPVATPNVVGMDVDHARDALAQLGLSAGRPTERPAESVGVGKVLSQVPPAGSIASPGSTVSLVISSAPETIRIPNVKGRTESRAKERLKSAGFRVKVVRAAGSKPLGTVVSQKPSGRAAPGKTITITVSSANESGQTTEAGEESEPNGGEDAAATAFEQHKSGVQITGEGTVVRVLPDDNEGDRHQRFIIRLSSGQTLLVAHNIDIAPRVRSLGAGDVVAFRGVYEWNAEGGTVHWTHHDPDGRHTPGWLKHDGSTYQ